MAMKTQCQTPDASFSMHLTSTYMDVSVDFGRSINLTQQQAELLEANIHNALELVLAPYYRD